MLLFHKEDIDLRSIQSISRWIVLCSIVGLVAGLAAIAFYWALDFSKHVFLDGLAGYRPIMPGGEHPLFEPTSKPFNPWILLCLPALGGLISGWLVYQFAPEAEGHGTDSVIEAYHHKQGDIRARVPFVKGIASAITIGTGGSAGREGPIAQIAAGFGSFLGKWLKLTSHERRLLMAAGMGAGVGAIFHAPLAGGLFAAEVLYRRMELEYEAIVPAFVSSIIAYAVFTTRFGWKPLFASADFAFRSPIELVPYLVLAIVLAVGAVLYIRVFYSVRDLFASWKIPAFLKPAIGGLVVGIIGFFLPQAIGTGYGVIQQGITGHVGWVLLLVVALAKIVATAFSIGSGGSGGVFGPAIVIGGALGGAVGLITQTLVPQLPIEVGAFIIVGMAGFFSAAAHTPISTIIMVSEMTGDYQLLVPSMWVCIIAFMIIRRSSIYEKQLASRMDAPYHLTEMMEEVLTRLMVRDALCASNHEPVKAIPEAMHLQDMQKLFAESTRSSLPVVDQNGDLIGMVSEPHLRGFTDGDRELSDLVVAKDIALALPTLTEDETLYSAMQKLARVRDAELAVVDAENPKKLVDMLNRQDLIATYDLRVQEEMRKG